MRKQAHVVAWDTRRMLRDIAERGWLRTDLAREAALSDMTVSRFLRGETQTAKTAKKLADALGFSVRRYMSASEKVAS